MLHGYRRSPFSFTEGTVCPTSETPQESGVFKGYEDKNPGKWLFLRGMRIKTRVSSSFYFYRNSI